nr:SSI family serine proteinase inhibitor [Pseudarthrobacter phenanthrenivorans]
MKDRPRSMTTMSLKRSRALLDAGHTTRFHALAVLLAASLLSACSPGQSGGSPSGETSAPSTATPTGSAGTPTGTLPPDAETSVPAPAPEPSAVPSGPGQGNAELAITVTPAEGEPEVNYTLVCAGGVPVAESEHPAADAACAALKENAGLLAPSAPATDKVCTEQYGGPQKATVSGIVDGVPVDAAFSRTNGCEISAWDAAKDVLGAAGGA